MAKTKFFRVAVEGKTVDGREITRDMIQQMADTYVPATYTARINCEHLRGYSPEGPFNAWGDVFAVKAEQVDVELGGKTEKRLALFAQLDVTDQAREYNKAGQKIFPSVEVAPNFSGTGKAYLVGFAVTDTPASIATQAMKFSARDDKRKDNLLTVDDDGFEIEVEEVPAGDIVTGAFGAMKKFFDTFGRASAPENVPPVEQPKPVPGTFDAAAFMSGFSAEMEKMTGSITKSFSAFETRLARMDADHKALAESVEKAPSGKYNARPLTSGGGEAIRAEC